MDDNMKEPKAGAIDAMTLYHTPLLFKRIICAASKMLALSCGREA